MGRTTYYPSRSAFVADQHSIVRNSGRQIDWANVGEAYRTTAKTITTSAGAAADATSISVVALPVALPAGTILYFGESKEFARLTAAAALGATSITVEALPAAIESGDSAIYGGTGPKVLPAGTVVGELLGAGKISPRIETTNPATGILEAAAVENDASASLSGYGVIIGGALYENLLPEASGSPKVLASAVKTELQTAGVGTGFAFAQFSDSRAS